MITRSLLVDAIVGIAIVSWSVDVDVMLFRCILLFYEEIDERIEREVRCDDAVKVRISDVANQLQLLFFVGIELGRFLKSLFCIFSTSPKFPNPPLFATDPTRSNARSQRQ